MAERHITSASGRYVDVAVMSPVYPKRHRVPLLISGEWTAEVKRVLKALAMSVRIMDGPVGRASSIKMVRSIFVKGMEALTAECTLAAAAAGVTGDVLPSLKERHPFVDVEAHAIYNFDRSLTHGERRSAEMLEVAKMLKDLDLPNVMSSATAEWQKLLGDIGGRRDDEPTLEEIVGALLPELRG